MKHSIPGQDTVSLWLAPVAILPLTRFYHLAPKQNFDHSFLPPPAASLLPSRHMQGKGAESVHITPIFRFSSFEFSEGLTALFPPSSQFACLVPLGNH